MQNNFYGSLPKKRMGAGVLFWDGDGRVLLVEPSYKPRWEIVGGIVESNESPRFCAARETTEEIGLRKEIGRLLIVDYNPPQGEKTESLMFVFDGGVLTAEEIAQITLPPDELLSFGFFTEQTLPANLSPTLRTRILAAWAQKRHNTDAYLENPENNQ